MQEEVIATPNVISPKLQHLAVDIESLAQDPVNVRKHDKRNLDAIKASLARVGQVKPIVLAENGVTVIAGNGTLIAAQSLGWKKIAAVETELTGSEATAYSIADNRTTDLSEFDNVVLAQVLDDLTNEEVEAAGFDPKEIEKLAQLNDDVAEELDSMHFEFRVVVECENEEHQSDVVTMLESKGLKCQKLIS